MYVCMYVCIPNLVMCHLKFVGEIANLALSIISILSAIIDYISTEPHIAIGV